MLVSRRGTAMLLEAVARCGIDPGTLCAPLGLDWRELAIPRGHVSWSTLVRLVDQLSALVDHDAERLRTVGRNMMLTSPLEPVRRIARSVVSAHFVYSVSFEWVTTANFPHVRWLAKRVGRDQLLVHVAIPEPDEPCKPFFIIGEGALSSVPTLLGLEPAQILESQVTERAADLLLAVPRHPSGLGRRLRSLFEKVTSRTRLDLNVFERQRQELAEALEEVTRSHREQRALLERLPDLVVVHAKDKVVWANRALVSTLGWNKLDELVGRPLAEVVDRRSLELFSTDARGADDEPTSPDLTRAWLLTRSGRSLLVEVAPAQSVVFDGESARLVVGRDIDERARLHERLAAADRVASLGLLAAGVAHEVNNPLGYVLNNIEVARGRLAALGAGGQSAMDALSVALEGVDRIRLIVRELLLVARGGDDRLGPTDVGAVIESTLSLAAPEIAHTARLVTQIGEAPLARANVAIIAQIILNLTLNAIEAMTPAPEVNTLTVRVGTSGDGRVAIEVSDTGSGISEHDLPRVFEPFFTTKPAGMGTGLGLAITQRLVLELGGQISVMSAVGVGSTFRVLLPAAVTADATSAPSTALMQAAPR